MSMEDPGSARQPGWARAAHAELQNRALQLDARLREACEGRTLLEAQLHELRSRNVEAQYQVAAAHEGLHSQLLTGAEQQVHILHLQGCLQAKEAQVQALQEQLGRLAMQLPGHGVGGSMQSGACMHAMQCGAWVDKGCRTLMSFTGMLIMTIWKQHACMHACVHAYMPVTCVLALSGSSMHA